MLRKSILDLILKVILLIGELSTEQNITVNDSYNNYR